MNPIYIFFKHGWMVFGAIFLLTIASVYVQTGQGEVILEWASTPRVSTWQRIVLGISGGAFLLIAIFRFTVDRS